MISRIRSSLVSWTLPLHASNSLQIGTQLWQEESFRHTIVVQYSTHIVNILYSCNITIHMDNLILKTVLFQIIPICYHHSYQIAHHAIISHKLTFFYFIQDGRSKLVSCSNLSTRYQFTIRPSSILCILRKGKGDNTTLSQKIKAFHTWLNVNFNSVFLLIFTFLCNNTIVRHLM